MNNKERLESLIELEKMRAVILQRIQNEYNNQYSEARKLRRKMVAPARRAYEDAYWEADKAVKEYMREMDERYNEAQTFFHEVWVEIIQGRADIQAEAALAKVREKYPPISDEAIAAMAQRERDND